ncbi:MAG: rhomboid family intramembrane serine protease [Candidatus Eremiobacteraeota bacterium]|nr:rhomboid family intramembrane serine protease [Candidatus Eremiobacteraeota bacterium]
MLTRALLVTNIAVFVWTTLNHVTDSNQLLINAGAFYGPAVDQGQWWRAITCGFLHGGLLHISFNMFALWQVGTVVEDLYGMPKMAVLYFGSLLGSAGAIYHYNYADVTIGASGAIFGLFGALAAAGLRLGRVGQQLVRSMLGIVLINVLIGFMVPNISQAGHIGGLVAGFVIGLLVYVRPEPRRPIYVDAQHQGNVIEAELLPPEGQPKP